MDSVGDFLADLDADAKRELDMKTTVVDYDSFPDFERDRTEVIGAPAAFGRGGRG